MHSLTPLRIAVSQVTTLQWELPEELCHCVEHGFDSISLLRTKLSDIGVACARELLQQAGVRVSSLQWAGGFTGSEGQTFQESLADCYEAIESAEQLACPVLTIYVGCRGGHTLSHARRLVRHALRELAPVARASGVTLAVKPSRPLEATGCGFMTSLEESVAVIEEVGEAGLGLAVDLWSFADDPWLVSGDEQLLRYIRLVSVADRNESDASDQERLPPGAGSLPLARQLTRLIEAGYRGDIEIDPVGDTVMRKGYEETLATIGRFATDFQLSGHQVRLKRQVASWPALAAAGSPAIRP